MQRTETEAKLTKCDALLKMHDGLIQQSLIHEKSQYYIIFGILILFARDCGDFFRISATDIDMIHTYMCVYTYM